MYCCTPRIGARSAAERRRLKEKGVRWKELDIEADPAHRQAMAEASGRSSVPQIFINGTLIGGSDELFALDVRGELDKLLGRNPPAT
jgi:glutaredoxin 3